MSFVTDALEKMEGTGHARENNGVQLPGHENFLEPFRERNQWDDEPKFMPDL